MTFGIQLKSRIEDKDYNSEKIMRTSNQQQNRSGQIMYEAMIEKMWREKLETIRSKKQFDAEIDSLWEYVKPEFVDLIALDIKAKRKTTDENENYRKIEFLDKNMAELRDKAMSIDAELEILLNKVSRIRNAMALVSGKASDRKNIDYNVLVNKLHRKERKAYAALSAASKKNDEMAELLTEVYTIRDRVTAMFSKVESDESERKKLMADVECKRDKLNALLTMMEDKHVEVGALHQESSDEDSARAPSDEGSARAPSGNLTAGSDCVSEEDSAKAPSSNLTAGVHRVLHKASRLFGSSKINSFYAL